MPLGVNTLALPSCGWDCAAWDGVEVTQKHDGQIGLLRAATACRSRPSDRARLKLRPVSSSNAIQRTRTRVDVRGSVRV